MANARTLLTASLLVATTVLALPGVASAQSWEHPLQGFYIGAGGGFAHNEEFGQNLGVPFSKRDAGHAAWKAFLGYSLDSFFSIQASYQDFGTDSVYIPSGEKTVHDRGYNFDGIISVPATDEFSLFVEGGAAKFHVRTVTPTSITDEWKGFNPDWGGGVQFNMTQNVALRGEWQKFYIPHNNTQLYSGSLVFRF